MYFGVRWSEGLILLNQLAAFILSCFVLYFCRRLYVLHVPAAEYLPFKDKAQTALFKDPIRTAL
jgi:hypothetical protein